MTERLTRRQAAILGAYTGITCGPFEDIHAYAEERLGRPIFTHELPGLADQIRSAAAVDFFNLCATRE